MTWTEIKGWETMGPMGDSAAFITTSLIDAGRDLKMKGTKNAGQMQCNFGVIASDPGQIALIAAAGTNNNDPIRIELNDKPVASASPKNGPRYFMVAAAKNRKSMNAEVLLCLEREFPASDQAVNNDDAATAASATCMNWADRALPTPGPALTANRPTEGRSNPWRWLL